MTADVPGTGRDVLLRDGWHALETFSGETFRWARNDARLVVPAFESATRELSFEIEIGPGVSERPALFSVVDLDDVIVFKKLIQHRQTVHITLRNTLPIAHSLRLHVRNGGNAYGLDRRILDYRLLWASLKIL